MTASTSADGHHQFEFWVVSFIDILGFRNMVTEDAQSLRPQFLERIVAAIKKTREISHATVTVESFSDSVILSAPLEIGPSTNLLESTLRMQRQFVLSDVLVRGGISFGKHHNDDKILFSEALVKAYDLESRYARVPRILVDDNLLDWLLNLPDLDEANKARICSLLRRDRDNRSFLHYLSEREDLTRHASITDARLRAAPSDAGILEKAQWLLEYHNYCARESGNESLCVTTSGTGFSPLQVRV